jgi:hypothetical protein
MLRSDYRPLCPVAFPAYAARQHYMHICPADALSMPAGMEEYIPIVAELLDTAGIWDSRDVHITVDEKIVEPGMSQRRPKPHVDGCFVAAANRWGGPGPGWLHTCNDIGVPLERMAIIVAASVPGCRAWRGDFQGEPGSGGDLSHIQNQLNVAHSEVLPANAGYLLTPDCVHESMVYEQPTQRQFLRIAFAT